MWVFNSNIHVDIQFQHHWPGDESPKFNLLFSCSDLMVAQGFSNHPCTRVSTYTHARQFPDPSQLCSDSVRQLLPYLWQGSTDLNSQQKFRATALHKGKILKCAMQLFSHVSVLCGSWGPLPSTDASYCNFSGSCMTTRNSTFFHFSHHIHRLKMFCLTSDFTCICCSVFSKYFLCFVGVLICSLIFFFYVIGLLDIDLNICWRAQFTFVANIKAKSFWFFSCFVTFNAGINGYTSRSTLSIRIRHTISLPHKYIHVQNHITLQKIAQY